MADAFFSGVFRASSGLFNPLDVDEIDAAEFPLLVLEELRAVVEVDCVVEVSMLTTVSFEDDCESEVVRIEINDIQGEDGAPDSVDDCISGVSFLPD